MSAADAPVDAAVVVARLSSEVAAAIQRAVIAEARASVLAEEVTRLRAQARPPAEVPDGVE